MNGFVKALTTQALGPDPGVMGYYDRRDLPYYWKLADRYVLFDRFFQSANGGSIPNHLFWVTGTVGNPNGYSVPPDGFNLPNDLRPARRRRDLLEVLRQGLRPAPHLQDERGEPPGALGPALVDGPLYREPAPVSPHRRPRRVLRGSASRHPARSVLHGARRPERAPAGQPQGRPAVRRQPCQRADGKRLGANPPSCGATTTGAASTTTSGPRRWTGSATASACRRCW